MRNKNQLLKLSKPKNTEKQKESFKYNCPFPCEHKGHIASFDSGILLIRHIEHVHTSDKYEREYRKKVKIVKRAIRGVIIAREFGVI